MKANTVIIRGYRISVLNEISFHLHINVLSNSALPIPTIIII